MVLLFIDRKKQNDLHISGFRAYMPLAAMIRIIIEEFS